MHRRPVTFRDQDQIHHADTCQPLVDGVRRGEVRLEALARGAYPGKALPKDAVPGVRSIGFWDAGKDQDWGLPEHRNEGIEITYLETGRLAFSVEEKSFPLNPGDLTVTRPWQPHSVGDSLVTAGRLYWIILDIGVRHPHQEWRWPSWLVLTRTDLDDLTNMLRQNEQPVWHGTPELGRCFVAIGQLVAATGSVTTIGSRLATLVNELFICLLEMLRLRGVVREPALMTAYRTVEMFLKRLQESVDEGWTLEDMAEATGLKRTRFTHYCRMITNRTPRQYLNDLRIKKAQALMLKDPSRSVTDVAFDCGFSSSQYFATTFRRMTGKSPRDHRQPRPVST
ncbi:MAG: AraC family transcriptional regulator [Acidobacteria bacterium]|nr:MAG: AraC family transcriptional regulator [Acidobacteriota bacterium]